MQEVSIAENITVKIKKHRRARHMKLTIHQNGSINLTLPYYVPYFQGKLYLKQKKEWILKSIAKLDIEKKETRTPLEEKKLKKIARETITNLVKHYASIYSVNYNKIFIKGQKTLWGSCSHKKNLNFNWRITLAPEEITKYIVVHEICHLREMNHSKKFWQLVALAIPHYKECQKWLRNHGHTLY